MLSQATAQRVEHWKLSELPPYPRNSRRHSDAQMAQIAGSITVRAILSPFSQIPVLTECVRLQGARNSNTATVPVAEVYTGGHRAN